MGPPGTAIQRLPAPAREGTIRGGCHVWCHDGDDWPADHKNPDALWFEARTPLTGPHRPRKITLAATRAVPRGHVLGQPQALADPR